MFFYSNFLCSAIFKGLALGSYLATPTDDVYDLFAVSNHIGGLGGGHYTAYALNSLDQEWLHLDDSSVTTVVASRVVSSSSYILM